ncbi:unnamed protein product [Polarella glacialis]|uniref:Uncharacterized protein n=1 Tax=Polarella glacialis TaxID=89957 RepID=A0A813GI67_POLGL|nr:unnamed protein product [Polarella glacialis]
MAGTLGLSKTACAQARLASSCGRGWSCPSIPTALVAFKTGPAAVLGKAPGSRAVLASSCGRRADARVTQGPQIDAISRMPRQRCVAGPQAACDESWALDLAALVAAAERAAAGGAGPWRRCLLGLHAAVAGSRDSEDSPSPPCKRLR